MKPLFVERKTSREYVYLALEEPGSIENKDDGTIHYLKPISENEGRVLRVVTVSKSQMIKVITLFFDRRAGRIR